MSVDFHPGVRPQDIHKPRLFFRSFRKREAVAPASVMYTGMPVIGMLGNDRYGCCVYSGDGHTVEEQTFYGQGTEYVVTTAQVLAAYTQMTGFNPNDPRTDRGDTLQHGMEFLRNYGFGVHKIAAFAEIDPVDITDVQMAIAEFGAVAVGMAFPSIAMNQFNSGKPWDVTSNDGQIEGGHRVTAVGYDANFIYVLTWDKVQKMTYSFWAKYVTRNGGEAWASIGSDWVNNATGMDPYGVDKYKLGEQYAALTGDVNPFPRPPEPEPTPEPEPEPPVPPEPEPDAAELALAQAAHRFLNRWWVYPAYLADALKDWLDDKGL